MKTIKPEKFDLWHVHAVVYVAVSIMAWFTAARIGAFLLFYVILFGWTVLLLVHHYLWKRRNNRNQEQTTLPVSTVPPMTTNPPVPANPSVNTFETTTGTNQQITVAHQTFSPYPLNVQQQPLQQPQQFVSYGDMTQQPQSHIATYQMDPNIRNTYYIQQ